MESYHVRISKDDLVFSAAHFITYERDVCERLHGHNFRVAAEVHGPLDENGCVVDFLALHDAMKAILDELDHRVLLPTEHPRIRVTEVDCEIEVTFDRRRWVFPREECAVLPVWNTTAELLARHIGRLLLARLDTRLGVRPSGVRIEVDECFGQLAVCELRGD